MDGGKTVTLHDVKNLRLPSILAITHCAETLQANPLSACDNKLASLIEPVNIDFDIAARAAGFRTCHGHLATT
jgi:hypothetical protein